MDSKNSEIISLFNDIPNDFIMEVLSLTIPTPNPINNSANVVYNFTIDPSSSTSGAGSANSNFVYIQVNEAIIDYTDGSMNKYVNTAYAKIGDTLDYTIGLKNTGSTIANSVVLTDTIPIGTTFVTNSVTVNGITQLGANPQVGISVGSIGVGNLSTVVFQVVVNTIPTINPIPNNSTVTYQYTVNPSSAPTSGSENSNSVTTQINQANVNSIKSVNTAYTKIGDILTYTIGLSNIGNTTANNLLLTDTIPTGTSFVNNSVAIKCI